jgi:lipoprotein-anchoring transpeptidase ErfK/SrfK
VALLSGCSASDLRVRATEAPPLPPSASPSEISAPVSLGAGTAATATRGNVTVHDSPGGAETARFENPQQSGAPLTFLVVEARGAWLEVHLPQRPNGSTGWISADDVMLHRLEYSLHVSTQQNTLTVRRNDALIETYPVATGTGGTPTPTGKFYLTELIAPTNDGYGPFAFGLSAFSDVLSSFGGGPGQVGLHGTDDAASIGTAASHGCIRLSNEHIAALAAMLPLGTPITIN